MAKQPIIGFGAMYVFQYKYRLGFISLNQLLSLHELKKIVNI